MPDSNSAPVPLPNLAAALLAGVSGRHRGVVTATEPGIIAGLRLLEDARGLNPAGDWRVVVEEGTRVEAGAALVEATGSASELGVAEDFIVGPLGFASGIATRAMSFVAACPPGLRLACGGWKKLPAPLKPALRAGLAAVGVLPRLVEGDFIYVNKNAVKLLGGVAPAIAAGCALNHGPVVIQVRNVDEALFAAQAGAGIIMVDTARVEDLSDVHHALVRKGLRKQLRLAFGGGVRLQDLGAVRDAGADAVDVGRAILDAPLLDLRFEVVT